MSATLSASWMRLVDIGTPRGPASAVCAGNPCRRSHAPGDARGCTWPWLRPSPGWFVFYDERGGGWPMTDSRTESTPGRRDQDWDETLTRLRGFVAARVGDPELAADISQDVVVRKIGRAHV